MTINNKIKRLRKELNISQVELAEKIGTTKQNIYKYENGLITNIPTDKIELLAEVLGTTPQYLSGWEKPAITDQEKVVVDFMRTNPDALVAFTSVTELTEEQKTSIIAGMIAQVNALKKIND